jgi:hypothetical protein
MPFNQWFLWSVTCNRLPKLVCLYLLTVISGMQQMQSYSGSGQWQNNTQYANGLPSGQPHASYTQPSQGMYKKPQEQRSQQCKSTASLCSDIEGLLMCMVGISVVQS